MTSMPNDEAVALYGENSEQARQLEQDIAALEAQYEGTEGTIEDYIAKNDALIESHDKLISPTRETDSQLTSEEEYHRPHWKTGAVGR